MTIRAREFEVDNGEGIKPDIRIDPESLRESELYFEIEQDTDIIIVNLECLRGLVTAAEELKAGRAAIAAVDREIDLREQNAKTLTNEQIDELWRKSCSLEGFSTAQFVRHFARAAIAAVQSNASTHELNSANSFKSK